MSTRAYRRSGILGRVEQYYIEIAEKSIQYDFLEQGGKIFFTSLERGKNKLRFLLNLPRKTYQMPACNRPLMLGRALKYHTFLINS